MNLNTSPVIYDPVKHTYTLGSVSLKGITKIIKDKLFPDEYANVPEATLEAAKERGHRIHSAIELYDTSGITTGDCAEFAGYISEVLSHPFMQKHAASEYVVSDNKKYASAIDKVYMAEEGAILADIKTTYKLNKEYVAWQLSVYAYFFKILNPDIPVVGAYAIWLKGNKHRVYAVTLRTEDEVKELLYGETCASNSQPPNLRESEFLLAELRASAEKAVAAYEEAKVRFAEEMADKGLETYRGEFLNIGIRGESTRTTFDSKAFAKDNPTLFAKYTKTVTAKGSITIRSV